MTTIPTVGIKVTVAMLFMSISTITGRSQAFTFEDAVAGYYASALTVTNSGLTLTITPEGVPTGLLVIADGSFTVFPSLLGTRAVMGSEVNPLTSGRFVPLRFTFSTPVSAITFAFGDGGGDDDSPVIIRAFNSGNMLLGTLTATHPVDFGNGMAVSGAFEAASYFIVGSGSVERNENSLLWEIQSVTPVPEPSAGVLSVLGFVALLVGLSRSKHRT